MPNPNIELPGGNEPLMQPVDLLLGLLPVAKKVSRHHPVVAIGVSAAVRVATAAVEGEGVHFFRCLDLDFPLVSDRSIAGPSVSIAAPRRRLLS